jgi:hypothetical protein
MACWWLLTRHARLSPSAPPAGRWVVRKPGLIENQRCLTRLAGTEAILNIAGSGKFSSDRAIAKCAAEIWNAKAVSGVIERDSARMTISPLAGNPAPKEMLIASRRAPAVPGRLLRAWESIIHF